MFAWGYEWNFRNYHGEEFREGLLFLFRKRRTHLRGIQCRCMYARLLWMRKRAVFLSSIQGNRQEIHGYAGQVRSNNQDRRALILSRRS